MAGAWDTGGPRFERVPWEAVDWAELDGFTDRNVFQTRAWLEFLADIQRAEPVIAVLRDGSARLGYFTGLTVRRLGLGFLGSPLPGWTTPYMGFNLNHGVPRAVAARALAAFAFRDLGCAHLELRDRWLTTEDTAGLRFDRRRDVGYDDRTFEVDLSRDEAAIFGGMDSACRRAVRRAEKVGLTVEEAHDEAFATEFYDQITAVFLRQGMVPTYSLERVQALIRHLEPAGLLLRLRARDAEGRCIATGIFPAFGETMIFWGGASSREHQHNRPNEALHWHAMRYWKARGITRYDLYGFREYKRKYGGAEIAIPGFRASRNPVISFARTAAPAGVRARQIVVGQVSQGTRAVVARLTGDAPPAPRGAAEG